VILWGLSCRNCTSAHEKKAGTVRNNCDGLERAALELIKGQTSIFYTRRLVSQKKKPPGGGRNLMARIVAPEGAALR